MDDDYIFRRELDFQTNLPELIVHFKNDRKFRKLDTTKKKELFDKYYSTVKNNFLSEGPSTQEKLKIENTAMEQMLERARQELTNTMH